MTHPIRIALLGAFGRMGRTIAPLVDAASDLELVACVDVRMPEKTTSRDFSALEDAPEFDLLIDFSIPQATEAAIPEMERRRASWLVATTGISQEVRDRITALARRQPVFMASNTSLGVAVMQRLCAQAAAAFAHWDCEIVETHHRNKLDAPSGTALSLAQNIATARAARTDLVTDRSQRREIRPNDEIGIASLRGGTVVGEHSALWFGPGERFEIRHTAENRDIFAHGACQIARWIANQPEGLYGMDNLVEDILRRV